MNGRIIFRLVALAAILVNACGGTQNDPGRSDQQFDRQSQGTREALHGASIVPPAGLKKFESSTPRGHATVWGEADKSDTTRTITFSVQSEQANQAASPETLARAWTRTSNFFTSGGPDGSARYRERHFSSVPEKVSGGECARYKHTIDDRFVPNRPGEVWILDFVGLACPNLASPPVVYFVTYSWRYKEGTTPQDIAAQGEVFLKSFELTKP